MFAIYTSIVGVVLLCGLSSGGSPSESNRYMDNVLFTQLAGDLKSSAQDPATVPGFKTEFKDKFMLMNVKVKTDYNAGTLEGLSKIQRATDCSETQKISGEYLMTCTLALGPLVLEHEGKTKYGKVPSISIKGKAEVEKLYLAIELSSFNNGQNPTIKTYRITNGVNMDPQFSGLGPANQFLKGLKEGFQNAAISSVEFVVNYQFRGCLERAIRSMPLPL